MNLVLKEKGRIRFLVWSDHRRVNIDVFGGRLVLKERLHHLVEAKDVVEVADPSRRRFDGDIGNWHLLRIPTQRTVKIPERGKRLVWHGAFPQVVIPCAWHHRPRLHPYPPPAPIPNPIPPA